MGKRFKKKFRGCFYWDQPSSDGGTERDSEMPMVAEELVPSSQLTNEEARLLKLEEDYEFLVRRMNAFGARVEESKERHWAMINKYLVTESAEITSNVQQPSSLSVEKVAQEEKVCTNGSYCLQAGFGITNDTGLEENQGIDSNRFEETGNLQESLVGRFGIISDTTTNYWGMNTVTMNGRTKVLQPLPDVRCILHEEIFTTLQMPCRITLKDLMMRQQFDESHARFLSINILESLRYLHGLNVVHGRISPNNIIFTESGYPCLTGFERFKTKTDKLRPKISLRVEYASPEEIQSEPITNATDVFQAGILVYALLYGKSPFKAESYEKSKAKVLDKSFIPEFESGTMSKDGRNFIQKLLKKKPDRRFKLDKCKKRLERAVKWFKEYPKNAIINQDFPSPFIDVPSPFMEFLPYEKVDN